MNDNETRICFDPEGTQRDDTELVRRYINRLGDLPPGTYYVRRTIYIGGTTDAASSPSREQAFKEGK